MQTVKSQTAVIRATEFLRDARSFSPEEIARNADKIGKAIAVQVQHTRSFVPAIGQFLHFQGRPFQEGMAKMMQPAFKMDMSPASLWKCGRQVGKSLTMAAKAILLTAAIPHFNTLTVTPLFEMTRRFSTNYVNPLIKESPVKSMLTGAGCTNNVLQKTFANNSMMHFSFAYLDCDRVRGLSIDRLAVDECQDIDPDFIPIMAQTMGRSKYRIQDFSGTPKTFDNTIEILWQQSSRAEWIIKCHQCGYSNNPHVEADALKMIGKHTLVCAKCKVPISSSLGNWEHTNLDDNRRVEFPGYHVPQFILPFHYESGRNWKIITDAINGGVAPYILYNEILAESYDVGSKLVTETELKTACKLNATLDYERAKDRIRNYIFRVIGIDWGGRGATGLSMTKIAVMGMTPDGRMELIYGENLSTLTDEAAEVIRCIQIFNDFHCHTFAHDAGGSGGMRDVLLSNTRFPMEKVISFVYVRAWANNPITYHPGTEIQPRAYYSLDKARSLSLMANMIKSDWLRFVKWESCKHLITDFLALAEEKNETKKAGDLYLITRTANQSDDFAHAVNFASMAAFHIQNRYPDLLNRVDQARFELTEQQMAALNPDVNQEDWEREDDPSTIELL